MPAARFAVLGPGGVGGLLAGLLARDGADVTCLAGPDTAAVLAERGVRVSSVLFGDSPARVRAAERLAEPVDACFVTVKATALDAPSSGRPPTCSAAPCSSRSSTASSA